MSTTLASWTPTSYTPNSEIGQAQQGFVEFVNRIVERAEADPTFRALLLRDHVAAFAEIGEPVPESVSFRFIDGTADATIVLPNGDTVSAMHSTGEAPEGSDEVRTRMHDILARSATDAEYRQRLLSDWRPALAEMGYDVPEGYTFAFVESDADATVVLPRAASANGELSDESLEQVAGGLAPLAILVIGQCVQTALRCGAAVACAYFASKAK